MDDLWNRKLFEGLVEICGPARFCREMRRLGAESLDEESLYEAVEFYSAAPFAILAASIYGELFLRQDPREALARIEAELEGVWRQLIDERDTSALSQTELERDEILVEQLEFLRQAADGLLAVWTCYVTHDDDPGRDANELIAQANRKVGSDLAEARRLWGQAGASALRGAPYWPLWESEVDSPPITGWAYGLHSTYKFLANNDLYPLDIYEQQRERMAAWKAQWQKEKESSAEPFNPFEHRLTPDTRRLMDVVLSGKQKLSDKQKQSLPPFTPEVVRQLIYILESGEYDLDTSPGKGWAPIHAAELLGKSGSPLAVAPLIRIVEENDYDAIVYSQALLALQELGQVALPMILDTMRYSTNLTLKCSLADPLGHLGKGDERAFRALEALYNETTWDDERMLVVMGLANLGDRRAVEIFHRALKSDRDITPEGIHEIMGALEALEPETDRRQLEQLKELAMRRYDSRFVRFDNKGNAFCRDCGSLMERGLLGAWNHVGPNEDEPILPSRPPLSIALPSAAALDPRFAGVGRNEPCPCGSGKKFKHCHGAPKQTVH